MKPCKDKWGASFFTSGQILQHGDPEVNGWSKPFYVVEEEEDSHPRITTYASTKDVYLTEKKIHRYCRISRFRGVLYHLMGMGTFTTRKSKDRLNEISSDLPVNISYTPPCLMWNTLWGLLKRNKISKCYSTIPTIVKALKLNENKKNDQSKTIFKKVMDDFIDMHNIFESIKKDMDRRYFPSLRAIALKLLHRHGFELSIAIPIARTPCKVERFEYDYSVFWDRLRENEEGTLNTFFGF